MGCCKCEEYKWDDPQPVFVRHNGAEYCIFHAPAETKVDSHNEMMRMVQLRIAAAASSREEFQLCNLSGAVFAENCSLIACEFPVLDLRWATFESDVTFWLATFAGSVGFGGVVFKGNTNFGGAKFRGDVSFDSATFVGRCIFDCAVFDGEVAFCGSHILNNFSFKYIKANKSLNFTKASFSMKVDFEGSVLGSCSDDLLILNSVTSTAESEVSFANCVVRGTLAAYDTQFGGTLMLDGTRVDGDVVFVESHLGNSSLQHCRFKGKSIFDRVNFQETLLLGAPVDGFCIMACAWPTSRGRCVTFDSRYAHGKGYFKIANDRGLRLACSEPPMKHLEDLYRRLKKVAQEEKDDQLASDFHYAEKELQRLRALKIALHPDKACEEHMSPCGRGDRIHFAFEAGILWLYKLISEYGEGPRRALIVLIVLLLLPVIGLYVPNQYAPSFLAADLRLSVEGGRVNQWLHFLPTVKLPEAADAGQWARFGMVLFQTLITLQVALFGFALRNRFKR